MGVLQDFRLDRRLRLAQVRNRLRSSLWVAPALAVAIAVGAAMLLVRIDRGLEQRRDDWFLFDGGPESARELLSTITSSMLTFTALVFSITILILQLASNQFSPRVIRTFLREPVTKWAMSLFVGTFVYSMVVLSQVRTAPTFVPAAATWFALVMAVVSVGVFIRYIHRMAHSIRAITVISKIAAETRAAIDRMFPDEVAAEAPEEVTVPDTRPDGVITHRDPPGVVAFVDADELVCIASRCDAVIEIVPRVGDFVPTGAALFRVWGNVDKEDHCRAAIGIELERTIEQDPAFGLRQIVDVAVRALSPGVNDPTTAVQALDHLHDLVRRLAVREFPARTRADDAGDLRVIAARPDFVDFVRLAFEEIAMYGTSSVQVRRRLASILEDCVTVAAPDRARDLERVLTPAP
ncbi:MAG: DUF2254 domain-containing protein [Deltaproteobacteria bacterium]|nr:DUF2254 domain-containing protein [Deltaproteobacteria bacterium]